MLKSLRKSLVFLALLTINIHTLLAKRLDPPNEAEPSVIKQLLVSTRNAAVFCGNDANMRTCRFFANALAHDLRIKHVAVSLSLQPERLVQSFYVPPIPFPFTGVTLRLIEARTGPRRAVRAYVSGFCFDQDAKENMGHRLPTWVETESARDTGPLESEEAEAASKLARELASYWLKPTPPNKPHSNHAKPPKR